VLCRSGPSRRRSPTDAGPKDGAGEGRGRPQAPQRRSDPEAARPGFPLTPGSSPRARLRATGD
jgi:hypothetical protein